MHYTPDTVGRQYGPNPMTSFAMMANVGDTFATGGLTITAADVTPHGPYTSVTFVGSDGSNWSQDYPR